MEIQKLDERRFTQRLKNFSKKHADEVSCVMTNLNNALSFWEASNLDCLRRSGLVRRESAGILAVDQAGCRKKPPLQLRLYFFCVEGSGEKICYLLTLGDKRSQEEDNNWSKQKLKEIGLLSAGR